MLDKVKKISFVTCFVAVAFLIIGMGTNFGNFAPPVSAQTSPQFTRTLYRSAFAKEQVSILVTSTILTAATYSPTPPVGGSAIDTRAEFADIECDSHPIRFWTTSDAPTASVGIELFPGNIATIQGYHDIANFHGISADGTTAPCNVQYYRYRTNTQ